MEVQVEKDDLHWVFISWTQLQRTQGTVCVSVSAMVLRSPAYQGWCLPVQHTW